MNEAHSRRKKDLFSSVAIVFSFGFRCVFLFFVNRQSNQYVANLTKIFGAT